MRISDWSSDVCSSDLRHRGIRYAVGRCLGDVRVFNHRRRQCPAAWPPVHASATSGGCGMNVLWYLIPISLALGGLGLALFFWALKSGQYEDISGAAERILNRSEERREGKECVITCI